jgi:transcriptional regulator with XRE-family HTH domain
MAKMVQKYPPKEKLKRLREARGLSMDKLAAMINREKPLIYRLEKGYARYNEETLGALAQALGVQPIDLLEDESPKTAAPDEDAAPYAGQGDVDLPSFGENKRPYVMKTPILDQIGILPGDIIVVDITPERISRLKDGDVVVAQAYDNSEPVSARTVVRQYLGPFLLLGNSSSIDVPSINMRKHDAAIKGVMVSSHRVRI